MGDAPTESIVGEVGVTAYLNINSTPEPPISEFTPHASTPRAEECTTPSTVLDEDMADTEEEVSESEISFSSSAASTSLWPESPNSAEREGIAAPIVDESRRQIVDRLMHEVRLLLSRQTGIRSRASSNESPRSPPLQHNHADQPAGTSCSVSKRSRDDDSGSEMPGDGSGDGGPAKRQRLNVPAILDEPRKFACPYFKRNSRLHQQYRSCAGPGWSTCHRVKYDCHSLNNALLTGNREHLYRRHKLPVRCPRCYTAFLNDKELSTHYRQLESCKIQQEHPVEGLDKAQEAQLRSRKRLIGTEEHKWKGMYSILFPDDDEDSIPSPYYGTDGDVNGQSDALAEYDRYMARELPRLVRTQLEATIMGLSMPLESQIQSQLVDIVRNCQKEVFKAYAANRKPQACTTGTTPGASSTEPPTLDIPPTDTLASINAFFAPPFLADNLLFTFENLPQNSTEFCTAPGPVSLSDSAYVSQNPSFLNDLDAFGQGSSNGLPQADPAADVMAKCLGSEVLASDTLQDDSLWPNSVEAWST
ncbi:hypothetical protein NA57DRAFT_53346 [Rhizodiscina lignyota]|uniref:C2H2-type domain-containing protein n=1 Tax=Rhizodiscina lignyota TaxID=1504668 RepID=A0A9P4IGX3_9PEZI|nr:hypothetical protein NA57DRAFT_53346 [Rhizodiscina lignyota]